jgi:hypothetical protein
MTGSRSSSSAEEEDRTEGVFEQASDYTIPGKSIE